MMLSVVIGTKNRALGLTRCLAHFARIRSKFEWELVVVDNGSTDTTPSVIDEFARTASFPVVSKHEPVQGVGRAKNVGWRAARGVFISFIDDDCYVAPDYVDNVVALFQRSEIGYGGGRVTLFDPNDYPVTIQLQDAAITIPPFSFIEPGLILGANMAFRRLVLEKIDGFDPAFGPGNKYVSDDPDIQARASFAGWTGIYDPVLTVAHHHGRDAAAAQQLVHTYCRSSGAYYAKFLLRSDSRCTFARHVARHMYWMLRGSNEPMIFFFRYIQGMIGYAVLRALHRL